MTTYNRIGFIGIMALSIALAFGLSLIADASVETQFDHFKSCYLQVSGFDSCSGFDYNTDGHISALDIGTFKQKANSGEFDDPEPVFIGIGGVSLTTLDAIADGARQMAYLMRRVYDEFGLLAEYRQGELIGGRLFENWSEELQQKADYISSLTTH